MKRNYLAAAVLLGGIGIAVLVIGGFLYIAQMQDTLRQQAISNVLEVTEQGAKSFESYIDQGIFMMEDRADNFSKFKSNDVGEIEKKLDTYEGGDPSFVCINLSNGSLYYNSGKSDKLADDTLEQYRSLPKKGVLEPFLSEYSGKRVIGYYDKFQFANGVEGMVMKTIPVTEFDERFSLSFFDGAGFNYIVNLDGDILLRSVSETGNRTFSNVFDVVALDDNTASDVELLRSSMEAGKYGVLQLAFHGSDYEFAFVPLKGTDDWYLISVVPNDVIMEQANQLLKTTQLFVGVLAIAALTFVSFLLVVVQHRRKVKEQEAEVLYREQLFDLLSNNADDVHLMLSSDAERVEYVSPNVERVMGISVADVKRDHEGLRKIISPNAYEEEIAEVLATPLDEVAVYQKDFIHPGTGSRRWFVESVYHTTIQSIERYILVFSDRTEDRKKEAALNEALQIAKVANESKSAFLANMSHDIRTPLNAILGLATLLRRDAGDPELVEQHTRKIASSGQHLLGLINDVLDMSKIESGSTSLNIGEFNLAELVDELGVIIRPQVNAKRQTFEIVTRDVKDDALMGDKLRINQVLINILSNAVKYTPEGGHIVLTVQQVGQVTQNIARIRFTVTDNGIGMSEEYLGKLFQPFTREISTLVNEVQGTGLGMAITKNLIDLMGGSIDVKSQAGKGSTFTIDLALRIQDQEDDPEFWKNHGIEHVLIVDDDEEVCSGVVAAMTGTGVNMQYTLGGESAVNMVRHAHESGSDFDLVLLDWKMPGMDGLETASKIRSTVHTNVPIVIISSYDLASIHEDDLSAIVDGFLAKPFFVSNFKELLRNIDTDNGGVNVHDEIEAKLDGQHFLYAEDNDLNAMILDELLDMEGATCHRVNDGQEAVDVFSSAAPGTYDAILMDIQMPVMNGYDATRAIRKLDHEEAKTIPIIALTANAFAEDVRDAIDAGMNAHLAKPIDIVKLVEVLSSL